MISFHSIFKLKTNNEMMIEVYCYKLTRRKSIYIVSFLCLFDFIYLFYIFLFCLEMITFEIYDVIITFYRDINNFIFVFIYLLWWGFGQNQTRPTSPTSWIKNRSIVWFGKNLQKRDKNRSKASKNWTKYVNKWVEQGVYCIFL